MKKTKDKILMCPPDFFTVDYVINPWMAGNEGSMSLELAKKQWQSLRDAISEFAEVVEIDPQPELPDMVFTANAGAVYGNKAIASHFMPHERRPEEAHFKTWFRDTGFELLALDDDALRAKLLGETARAPWSALERFFAQGVLLVAGAELVHESASSCVEHQGAFGA